MHAAGICIIKKNILTEGHPYKSRNLKLIWSIFTELPIMNHGLIYSCYLNNINPHNMRHICLFLYKVLI